MGTSFWFRGVNFLGSTLGSCYMYNKLANAKYPIIRETGPYLSRLIIWSLVHRRIYLEETQVEDETKFPIYAAPITVHLLTTNEKLSDFK